MNEKEVVLGKIIKSLAETFTQERKKSDSYKEMFKAGSDYESIFRELEESMLNHVHDACAVIEEKFSIKINNDQYHILMALPLLAKIAEQDARKNEGMACCVDKAYFILSEQFKKLGE